MMMPICFFLCRTYAKHDAKEIDFLILDRDLIEKETHVENLLYNIENFLYVKENPRFVVKNPSEARKIPLPQFQNVPLFYQGQIKTKNTKDDSKKTSTDTLRPNKTIYIYQYMHQDIFPTNVKSH